MTKTSWALMWSDLTSHDVRRQVIAGLVLAAILGGLGLLFAIVPTAAPSFRTWLLDWIVIHRLQVTLWSLGAFVLGALVTYAVCVRRLNARLKMVPLQTTREELGAARELMMAAQNAQRAHQEHELTKSDLSVLRVIAAGGKDARISLKTICASLKITEQRAIMASERLQLRSFAIAAGSDAQGTRLFELTTAGREECHKHGWI
jgi:hypothetical protein